MKTKRRLMANSASGLAERFVNLLVQVWLYQYLIKRISLEEYSVYPVVTALLVFIPLLLVVLTSGPARDTVEAHTRSDFAHSLRGERSCRTFAWRMCETNFRV